jgi:prevent-host-death family protein
MNIVNAAILKERLSYYLNLVKSGEEVVVTSHRHPVARILPVTAPQAEIIEPSRPVKDLRKIKGIKPQRPLSGVKSLVDDRMIIKDCDPIAGSPGIVEVGSWLFAVVHADDYDSAGNQRPIGALVI